MIKTRGWCDLCGKEIEDGNIITLTSTKGLKIHYDICFSCLSNLSKWMEKQRKKNGLEEYFHNEK